MTDMEIEIYDRLKNVVDIYRKKGISSVDIRKHFLRHKNFKNLLHLMRDIEYIYKDRKYPIPFDTYVYDMLFYRILMDRIYYEKDNPVEEKILHNFKNFEKSNETVKPKKLTTMRDKIEAENLRIETISTSDLRYIVANYEHKASKTKDEDAKKNYMGLAKKYKDVIKQREKEMYDDFMKNVDKEGRWISKHH